MKQERMRSSRAAAIAGVALLAAVPGLAVAEDRAALAPTEIIGNRELPKVLYIVPWKKPLPGDLAGRPVESVLDEALAPVDRDVFRRQVQYDAQVRPVAAVPDASGAGSTAPGAAPAHP